MTRLLFWSQHLLGIGHARRTAVLADGLARAGFDVTVAQGGHTVAGLQHGAARVVQLPAAHAADASFSAILDAKGHKIDATWHRQRTAALLGIAQEVCPDIILTELFPFGRRQFAPELLALFGAWPKAAVVASVRDILIPPRDAAKRAAMMTWFDQHYRAALIHGDPALVPLEASLPEAAGVRDRLYYTGYVATPTGPLAPTDSAGAILVSAGGGAVGQKLLRLAAAARARGAGGTRPWLFLPGPQASAALLTDLAAQGVPVQPNRPDYPDMLTNCALAVSQAGYNSVAELLQAGARGVLVPFAAPGQTEQTERARRLAAAGRVAWLAEDGLTTDALAAAIDHELARPLAPLPLRLDGASATANLLRTLL